MTSIRNSPAAGTAQISLNAGASFLGATGTVALRTYRKYLRSPQLLMTSIVGGATFVLLFRYIMGGAIEAGPVAYVHFLMPGMIMTSVLVNGTSTAIGVAEDATDGFFDRLRSMPAPRLALLTGRAVGDLAVMTLGIVVTIALGYLVGFRIQGTLGEAVLAFGICIVCGFTFVWMFIWIGLITGSAQTAQGVSMLVYPIIFVSSAYVPVDTLPSGVSTVAEHQPVTVMVNAVRSLALGDANTAGLDHTAAYWVTLSLIWCAGLMVVFAPLALTAYRRLA